jgi:predicted RNA-binding Zn-ribbon protein involved in translation (DUF1610 family)
MPSTSTPNHGSTGEREWTIFVCPECGEIPGHPTFRHRHGGIPSWPGEHVEAVETKVVPASQLDQVREERDTWKGKTEPDISPGDVIAAEPDGAIVLDDGITTWNPARAVAFLLADETRRADKLQARVEELEGQQEAREQVADSGRRHDLKCWPPYFNDVRESRKTFEVRRADRNFGLGDTLILHEFAEGAYTGKICERRVSYVLGGPFAVKFGIATNHVVMGLTDATSPPNGEEAHPGDKSPGSDRDWFADAEKESREKCESGGQRCPECSDTVPTAGRCQSCRSRSTVEIEPGSPT